MGAEGTQDSVCHASSGTFPYPMFVMRVKDFMSLVYASPHQELVAKGVVHKFDSRRRVTAVFVSHQWCGSRHADPRFQQLRVLQRVFAKASSGSLQVEADIYTPLRRRLGMFMQASPLRDVMSWVMWYDYFSIPQPDAPLAESDQHTDLGTDLGKAVSSLSAYVRACDHFLVLAPTVAQEDGRILDYHSWKSRGWCRFERFCRVLSNDSGRLLLVQREDSIKETGPTDYFFDPVGLGAFGAEADRCRLASVVRDLYDGKLKCLLQSGRLQEYRMWLAFRASLLEGFPSNDASRPVRKSVEGYGDDGEAGGFMSRFRLASPTAPVGGSPPLLLASRAGDVGAMTALLAARASVHSAQERKVPEFSLYKGQLPLHVAAGCGHAEAVKLLLDHGANANERGSCYFSPLIAWSNQGSEAVLRVLIESRAELDHETACGFRAVELSAFSGRHVGLKALLKAGASCKSTSTGLNPLHSACAAGAGRDIVLTLLDARASPNDRFMPHHGALRKVLSVFSVAHCIGVRTRGCLRWYHSWGATPLMAALVHGSHDEALALLERGADVTLKNKRGANAEALAKWFEAPESLVCAIQKRAHFSTTRWCAPFVSLV